MPQIYFENLKSFCNAEIFFWHIKEGCNELSEYIADNGTLLSEAKRRFKSESRQREWLATRALLHSTQYKGETILYNDNGTECVCSAGDVMVCAAGTGHAIACKGEETAEVCAVIVYA